MPQVNSEALAATIRVKYAAANEAFAAHYLDCSECEEQGEAEERLCDAGVRLHLMTLRLCWAVEAAGHGVLSSEEFEAYEKAWSCSGGIGSPEYDR